MTQEPIYVKSEWKSQVDDHIACRSSAGEQLRRRFDFGSVICRLRPSWRANLQPQRGCTRRSVPFPSARLAITWQRMRLEAVPVSMMESVKLLKCTPSFCSSPMRSIRCLTLRPELVKLPKLRACPQREHESSRLVHNQCTHTYNTSVRYRERSRSKRTVSQTYRDQVFITPSGMLYMPNFLFCQAVLGVERMLFALTTRITL